MMISEKMVFTSSNGNHLVLYARPPAGISIQKCSVRSSFLLKNKKGREETLTNPDDDGRTAPECPKIDSCGVCELL